MTSSSGNWFRKIFNKPAKPDVSQSQGGAPQPKPGTARPPGELYKKGEWISQRYEVHQVLGKGGFGVVYLAYSHELHEVYALKTFLDQYLQDRGIRERFKREAEIWVDLGPHPNLVRAFFVEEVAGRLYIVMEYIAPNADGLNTLDGYLRKRPPGLEQGLVWAVQVCYGMEFAYAKGLRAHRDLKPGNIMITREQVARVTDFGLAGVIAETTGQSTAFPGGRPAGPGSSLQTLPGEGFGTPTHMPPEQFANSAACDEHSDIYSFGVVLYQLAAGGKTPFSAPTTSDYWQVMKRLHSEAPLPELASPLFPIIQRCLQKNPSMRYPGFKDLRADLEQLLLQRAGRRIQPPPDYAVNTAELVNKGSSLDSLDRFEEAIHFYDQALALDPRDPNAWNNKGNSLHSLGRLDEAVQCFDQALEADPRHALAWSNKAATLLVLGRPEEALRCCDLALEIDPALIIALTNKAESLHDLGRSAEALALFDRILELDPAYAPAWNNKGTTFFALGRYDDAICCYDQALKLDPFFLIALNFKGSSLQALGRHDDAIRCFHQALEIDPRNVIVLDNLANSLDSLGRYAEELQCLNRALEINPRDVLIWHNKGACLHVMGQCAKAIECYDQALNLDPRRAETWTNKGVSLGYLNRTEEEIRCLEKALAINPRYLNAWINKGECMNRLGRYQEAVAFHDRALEIEPRSAAALINKGNSLHELGCYEDAVSCYDSALEINPNSANAWYRKAESLDYLRRHAETLFCYNQALKLNPRDEVIWYNKALLEDQLAEFDDPGLLKEAIHSYQQFLALAPPQYAKQIEETRQRLRQLGG